MTERSSVGDIHQDTRDHYLRSKDKTLTGQHSELSSHAGTTGQTGSSRPVKPVPVGSDVQREESGLTGFGDWFDRFLAD